MPGGVIGLIPYARLTGDQFVDELFSRDHGPDVRPMIRKAFAHRGVDMTAVLSEADFEFGTRIALREHWRALHGEVDTWDANARARGVDPRPLEEAVR